MAVWSAARSRRRGLARRHKCGKARRTVRLTLAVVVPSAYTPEIRGMACVEFVRVAAPDPVRLPASGHRGDGALFITKHLGLE